MYTTGLAYNISGQNVLASGKTRRSVVLNKYLYETIRLLSNSMPSSSSISKLPLTNSKQGAINFYIDYTTRYRSLRSRNNGQAKHIAVQRDTVPEGTFRPVAIASDGHRRQEELWRPRRGHERLFSAKDRLELRSIIWRFTRGTVPEGRETALQSLPFSSPLDPCSPEIVAKKEPSLPTRIPRSFVLSFLPIVSSAPDVANSRLRYRDFIGPVNDPTPENRGR